MASLTMSLVIVCRDAEAPVLVDGPADEKREFEAPLLVDGPAIERQMKFLLLEQVESLMHIDLKVSVYPK